MKSKATWILLVFTILITLSVGLVGQISVGGFTATAGSAFNFTPATTFRVQAGAGATAGATGAELEDTTAAMYHDFTGGVDSQVVTFPTSSAPSNGDCAAWVVSGSLYTLADFGSPCNSGLHTATNCASSASPAACGSAQAGGVVVAAAAASVVVDSTAVTANSEILVMFDSSLGTRLSVTCNTTAPAATAVTARTAATSFTITLSAAPITNPACFNYVIIN
jgi:hypothetical protein